MSLTFHTIELVIALQQHRSISKAAKSLYISEPALSKQIKKIETELDFPLIERKSTGCSLTTAGRLLAEKGEQLLLERDSLLREIHKIAETSSQPPKTLRLGLANCYAEALLHKFLPHYIQQYPDVKVELLINRTDILEKMCIEDSVDLIFTQLEPYNFHLKYTPVMKEETVLYIPSGYSDIAQFESYISKGSIPLKVLKGYPHAELIGHKRFFAFSEPLYVEAGFQPNTVFRSENWSTVLELIKQNMCYTIMPDIFDVSADNVHMLHIESTLPTTRTLALAHKADKRLPAEWQALVELTKSLLSCQAQS